MSETELQARFNRQLPDLLPAPDWDDVLRRASESVPAHKRQVVTPSRWGVVGARGGRRLALIALVAAVALLMLAAAALGYRYFSEPVSPGFRLYLNKLARGPIRFDPAKARLRVGIAVPKGVVLLWTAPSKRDGGSLVWGFQAQEPSNGAKGIHAAEVRDLGATCCGDTTAALNDWGGQALSQQAGNELWLEAGHVSEQVVRVAVKFRDGSTEDAQLQDGFFISTIDAPHFQSGHRPVALVAYDHSGAIVRQVPIDPSGFQGTHGAPADLHPRARGRTLLSFPLLVGGHGQIWISKGFAGSHSWTFVVDRRDQLLGAGYAALKDDPTNRRAVNLSALHYQDHGRRETIYGGDTWQIRSLTWIHPNGTRTQIPIHTTPKSAWPYIGNLVLFQTTGWNPTHGGVLIARDHHGHIVHRIKLSTIIAQPDD